MCLSYVGKRSMPEEGKMWKIYLEENSFLRSLYRGKSVLLDCWMLNQEPTTTCQYCHIVLSAQARYPSNFSSLEFYEHGFHGWKNFVDIPIKFLNYAIQSKINNKQYGYDFLDQKFYEKKKSNGFKFIIKRIFYKGYIAEDYSQVVARQIYVPQDTKGPKESSKIWEVNKKEYVEC